MAFIRTIPPAEAEGPVREMYERTQAQLDAVASSGPELIWTNLGTDDRNPDARAPCEWQPPCLFPRDKPRKNRDAYLSEVTRI